MCIKCVFGHTKPVVLACCEHVITFVPEITWRVTFMHPLVDIATDLSYRWKYWPKHSRYVLVDMIYWATCWPTHRPTMSQYFASMAVDTRSVWWPLNVCGISVNCWWYIDQLSYNTMCFRVFFKASSILEMSSTGDRKCYGPYDPTTLMSMKRLLKNRLHILFIILRAFEKAC